MKSLQTYRFWPYSRIRPRALHLPRVPCMSRSRLVRWQTTEHTITTRVSEEMLAIVFHTCEPSGPEAFGLIKRFYQNPEKTRPILCLKSIVCMTSLEEFCRLHAWKVALMPFLTELERPVWRVYVSYTEKDRESNVEPWTCSSMQYFSLTNGSNHMCMCFYVGVCACPWLCSSC